nr:hypothetical protein [Streptomyces sp. HNM0574]
MRNPIGPLPSSIYWRRRAVACAVLALVVLLAVWVSGLFGGGTETQGKGGGGGPAATITPGPTHSGPVVTERPGGREEADAGAGDAGSTGSGAGSGTGGDQGSGADGSAWEIAPGSSGAGSTGSGATGGGTGGAPAQLPACQGPDVTVKLRSLEKSYGPGEKPEFELTAKNAGGDACRVDLGRGSTVVTVTDADDEKVWTSSDCRRDTSPAYLRVPGGGEASSEFTWLRRPSAPDCGTPPATSAAPGEYEITVAPSGLAKAKTTFALES